MYSVLARCSAALHPLAQMLFDLRLLLVVIALPPALKTSISPEKKRNKKQERNRKIK